MPFSLAFGPAIILALPALLLLRIILLLPGRTASTSESHGHDAGRGGARKRQSGETCSLGVFLGSGGHSAEMRTLLSTLSFARYTPRTYVYCPGDEHSLRLVAELEAAKGQGVGNGTHTLLPLPRARRVAQPLASTVFSTIGTALVALVSLFILPLARHPIRPWAEVLLVNGPGTCVVVVAVSWIRRILGLPHTRIIYIESFARVTSLSLSAKLLRPFVDSFVVQWPQLAGAGAGIGVSEADPESPKSPATSTPLRADTTSGETSRSRSAWFRGRTVYKGWLV